MRAAAVCSRLDFISLVRVTKKKFNGREQDIFTTGAELPGSKAFAMRWTSRVGASGPRTGRFIQFSFFLRHSFRHRFVYDVPSMVHLRLLHLVCLTHLVPPTPTVQPTARYCCSVHLTPTNGATTDGSADILGSLHKLVMARYSSLVHLTHLVFPMARHAHLAQYKHLVLPMSTVHH